MVSKSWNVDRTDSWNDLKGVEFFGNTMDRCCEMVELAWINSTGQEVWIYKYQDTGGDGVLEACFQNMTPIFTLPKTTQEQPYSVVLY